MMRKYTFKSLLEILLVSTKLGLTSFGGPIAHLGYFHETYVRRRKWLDEKSYADLVALCQFLPGPASSQVGIGIGVMRGGIFGGILAFLGFTLPSVLMLFLFAILLRDVAFTESGWIHGLNIVAVVVVAHAISGMAKQLTPDKGRKTIALFALVVTLLWQSGLTQVTIILLAGCIGFFIYKNQDVQNDQTPSSSFPISRTFGTLCLALFFGLLILLPILSNMTASDSFVLFDSFYRSGAFVFGGGHVVLPLLEQEFVATGFVSEQSFLAGYGAAQAVPGPLFTFASYLGAVINGWQGAMIATAAIFLPALLLIFGTLPFWDTLRTNAKIKGAFMGVNAAVVGILIAAFYQPIWTSTMHTAIDFAFASILFWMLTIWKLPPWMIVVTGALGGSIISMI